MMNDWISGRVEEWTSWYIHNIEKEQNIDIGEEVWTMGWECSVKREQQQNMNFSLRK